MGTSGISCINRLQSQIEFEHQLFVERNQWINSSSAASSTTESNLSYFNKWSWPAIQFISVARLCLTLIDPRDWSTPGFPVHHQLLELTKTHVHWASDAIQPSHPLSSPSPPALSLSRHQGLFKGVNSLYQVAKYWSFSFSISPSNEYSGLISFRIDWFDLPAVQETLKSPWHFISYILY